MDNPAWFNETPESKKLLENERLMVELDEKTNEDKPQIDV